MTLSDTTIMIVGYNYRLTNIQSALGVAQLEQLPDILKRKKKFLNNTLKILKDSKVYR